MQILLVATPNFLLPFPAREIMWVGPYEGSLPWLAQSAHVAMSTQLPQPFLMFCILELKAGPQEANHGMSSHERPCLCLFAFK